MNGDEHDIARISCEEVLSKLYAWLDRELDDLTAEEIEHHLGHCRECFSRAEFEKVLRRRVSGAASEEPPPEVRERLNKLIRRF